jgi:hypothetical protein
MARFGISGKENVFGLEVPVDDSPTVEIEHPADNLAHDQPGVHFSDGRVALQKGHEITTRGQLGETIDPSRGRCRGEKRDDVVLNECKPKHPSSTATNTTHMV